MRPSCLLDILSPGRHCTNIKIICKVIVIIWDTLIGLGEIRVAMNTDSNHLRARFLSGPSSSSLTSAYCVSGCVLLHAFVNIGSLFA